MVIRSRFKDYYDFVATRFGGGDPRIVYTRGRLKSNYFDGKCGINSPKAYNRYYMRNRGPDMDYMYLIVCGRAYLLARPMSMVYEKFDVNTFSMIDPEEDKDIPDWIRRRQELVFGQEYPFLVDLCRTVGAPVFVIYDISYKQNREATYSVCDQIPILGSIGMAQKIDPYQMYQDIAVFMGNRMKATPDTQPPVELSNTQKILKAGFDLKKSFRHRT